MHNCYPNRPGHRGVDTSVAASDDLAPSLGKLQRIVLGAIDNAGSRGATGDEIAARLGWVVYQVRPRTAELRSLGKIVDSGQRRKGASGRWTIVWASPSDGPIMRRYISAVMPKSPLGDGAA